jgi:hypothetical protein
MTIKHTVTNALYALPAILPFLFVVFLIWINAERVERCSKACLPNDFIVSDYGKCVCRLNTKVVEQP